MYQALQHWAIGVGSLQSSMASRCTRSICASINGNYTNQVNEEKLNKAQERDRKKTQNDNCSELKRVDCYCSQNTS